MFGYLLPDYKQLSKEEKEAYRARYCGLCRTIGIRYGAPLRTALSYEMTLLVLVLDGLEPTPTPPPPRCIKHPFRRSEGFLPTAHQEYAADLTVLLLGEKCRDDIADEGSTLAGRMLRRLTPSMEKAARHRPLQAEQIVSSLGALSALEKQGCVNPDLPSGCFGDLVGKLAASGIGAEDSPSAVERLYEFGFALGKLLYLYDAHRDLKGDLKHARYNPFVTADREAREQILTLLQGDLLDAASRLPLTEHQSLIQNILSFPLF